MGRSGKDAVPLEGLRGLSGNFRLELSLVTVSRQPGWVKGDKCKLEVLYLESARGCIYTYLQATFKGGVKGKSAVQLVVTGNAVEM